MKKLERVFSKRHGSKVSCELAAIYCKDLATKFAEWIIKEKYIQFFAIEESLWVNKYGDQIKTGALFLKFIEDNYDSI